MQILSQQDARWSKDKLGASSLTMGRWGCTTTCISMASDYFNCYKSPKEIAHNTNNYTSAGLILWWNLKFDNMHFVERIREYTPAVDKQIREALANPDTCVLLEVNHGAHWVLGYSTKMFSNEIAVADPWLGKIVPVIKTYKNITGAAIFARSKAISENVVKDTTPKAVKPSKKLIKSALSQDIFFYNGVKKFLIPNWHTFVELFGPHGGMDAVEELPIDIIEQVPKGKDFPSLAP